MRYPTVERAAVRRCTVNTFSTNFKILIKRDVNYRHSVLYTMRNGSHAIALCPRYDIPSTPATTRCHNESPFTSTAYNAFLALDLG